jgi:hypothetical protein
VDPDGKVNFIAFAETGNYVCFSPSDARTLLEACAVKGSDLVAGVKETPALERAILAREPLRRLYNDLARGETSPYTKPKPYREPVRDSFLGDRFVRPSKPDYSYQ